MEIKDLRIAKLLKKHYCRELDYRLSNYSTDEDSQKDLEQMGELDYIKRELDWIIEDFKNLDHACGEDLKEAMRLKKTSKNFKEYELDPLDKNFKKNLQTKEIEFEQAKSTILEYKNALKLQKEFAKL